MTDELGRPSSDAAREARYRCHDICIKQLASDRHLNLHGRTRSTSVPYVTVR